MPSKTAKWPSIKYGSKVPRQLSHSFGMLVRNQKFQDGSFTTSFIEKDLEKYYFNSEYEEMLAAWLATKLFIEENLKNNRH